MKIETIKDFIWGMIDTLEARSLPDGATSKENNWITKGDKIEIRRGNKILGNRISGSGGIKGLFVARMADGTQIPFRTRGKKVEYYVSATETWTEIGTNILGNAADGKEISFAEYHSLSGDRLFLNSPYGPFVMIMLANPGSYADIYDSSKNFKGRISIKQNRTWLWGRLNDKTGVYGSKIDTENFTTVSAENIGTGNASNKTFAATLTFKAAGAKRTCFAIVATDGTEEFTDNNDGTLTGDKGGTGTINYMTGAISVTFNSAPAGAQAITCNYQWEDVTVGGIADFTKSATRVAGEGFVFRQDEGGGIVQNILNYGDEEYCMHEFKTWVLTLTSDDTNATNLIYREKLGIPNWRAAVPTPGGIYFLDDSDEKDPLLKAISYQPITEKVLPIPISKGKKYKNKHVGVDLSDYSFDQACGIEWGDYILIAIRKTTSTVNDTVVLYDKIKKTIDILDYWVSVFAIYNGTLIAGDPIQNNVYTLFSGVDDDDSLIPNSWEGNEKTFNITGMKKVKKLILEGEIGPDQTIKVSGSVDEGPYVELGLIEGDGSYVDRGQSIAVGAVTIGSSEVGGGGEGVSAYNYMREISLILGKFNKIKLKFEATKLGYASISTIKFYDIRIKSYKIPPRYVE